MKKASVFLIVVLLLPMLVADNLTTNTTEEKIANCSEQLEICIERHNSLLEDFKEGINCGTAFNLVKGMNEVLSEERDTCREEIGKIKVYKTGFYIFFIMLIMIAAGFLFQAIKKKNNLNKEGKIKNARKKEANR